MSDSDTVKVLVAAERMRKASGDVADDRPLVAFLYVLMRDHLPPGAVETIMSRHVEGFGVHDFSNGWLARHAQDLAERLSEPPKVRP